MLMIPDQSQPIPNQYAAIYAYILCKRFVTGHLALVDVLHNKSSYWLRQYSSMEQIYSPNGSLELLMQQGLITYCQYDMRSLMVLFFW